MVFRGVAWQSLSRISCQVSQFVISVILARTLLPQDFGLMAMVLVFIGFGNLFAEIGFGSAIVQKQDLEERQVHSVFWITIVTGASLTCLFMFLAPFLAYLYQKPLLEDITRLLSLNYLISAASIVPRALLQKKLAFNKLAKINMTLAIIPGLLAIAWAINGGGVWSLVLQSLGGSTLGSCLFLWHARWVPKMHFHAKSVGQLFHFGLYLSGFGLVNYWARNIDNLLIGKLFGSAELGIYNRAYSLMMFPILNISNTIRTVMFPAMSIIQNDKKRVKDIYLRSIKVIALISFPLMMGLCVLAEPFILVVYGNKWMEAIPVIQMLSVGGLIGSVCNPVGWIYTSQGRTDKMFQWGLIGSSIIIVSIITGVLLGSIQTIAIAYSVAMVLIFYPCIKFAGVLIDLKVIELVKSLLSTFLISLFMAFVLWAVGLLLPTSLTLTAQLFLQVIIGSSIFLGLVSVLKVPAYKDLKELFVKELKDKKRSAST